MQKQLSLLICLTICSNVLSFTPGEYSFLKAEFRRIKPSLVWRATKATALIGIGMYTGVVLSETHPATVKPPVQKNLAQLTQLQQDLHTKYDQEVKPTLANVMTILSNPLCYLKLLREISARPVPSSQLSQDAEKMRTENQEPEEASEKDNV